MCPYVSPCVPLCPPVSLYQLHPLSGQRLLGCPRENHSTLHIFSKYPPATNVHNMLIYVHSIIRSTHGGWLFNGCPTAQPTTECKKRICPKKIVKITPKRSALWEFGTPKDKWYKSWFFYILMVKGWFIKLHLKWLKISWRAKSMKAILEQK